MDNVAMSRVNATGGGVTYDRVRLVIAEGIFRLFDAGGNILVEGSVSTFAREGKTITAMVEDVEWTVTRKGCGCGGK